MRKLFWCELFKNYSRVIFGKRANYRLRTDNTVEFLNIIVVAKFKFIYTARQIERVSEIASTPWKYLATPHNKISFNVRCHRNIVRERAKDEKYFSHFVSHSAACLLSHTEHPQLLIHCRHFARIICVFQFLFFYLVACDSATPMASGKWLTSIAVCARLFSHIIGQIIDAIKNDWDGIEAMKRGFLPFFSSSAVAISKWSLFFYWCGFSGVTSTSSGLLLRS